MKQIRLAFFATAIIVSIQIPTMAVAAEGIGMIVPLSNETLSDLRGGYIGAATSSLSAHHALPGLDHILPLAALIRSSRALGQLRNITGLH
jgi:hypothetical protein